MAKISLETPSRFLIRYFTLALAAFGLVQSPDLSLAQIQQNSATYVSEIDEKLTIRRVAILPVVDNVDGIYARQIESLLNQFVKSTHRWDFVESGGLTDFPALIELEESPSELQQVTKSIDADAFIAAAASRGPKGISIRLNLFLKNDGKLLAQELLIDHPRTQIPEVRERVTELYRKLVAKLPYEGLILSRQQNRVTIGLGVADGLTKDQTVSAIQIVGVTRHPKFNFIISTEKEILGRIKILKVDETLSFGAIISEKERGAIKRLAKISGIDSVNYPVPTSLGEATTPGDLQGRPDASVTFGKDPKEWLPVKPPSFGQVGMKLGFGSYNSSIKLETAGALEARSAFSPSLAIHGEIWLTPEWTLRADLAQGIITTSNPLGGSSPEKLNQAMSKYGMEVVYNLLLRDDFFGPKLSMSAGVANFRMFVDDTSPRSLTTTNYSGVYLGLAGSFPVTDEKIWFMGGKLNLFLTSSLSESPESSGGGPKNTINDFSLFVEKKIAENLRGSASMDFSLYSTSFSGAGSRTDDTATSLSQRQTTLGAGITYMF